MVTIEINGKKHQLPQSWNETSKKQLIGIYNIIMADAEVDLHEVEIVPAKRIRMLQYLLGMDGKFMAHWHALRLQEHGEDGDTVFYAELEELCSHLNGFFDIHEAEEKQLYSIKLDLTKCHFPSLSRTTKKQKRKTYYGPADSLENLSLYELGMAFAHFEAYLKQQDLQQAHRLMAILYRPAKAKSKSNKQSAYQGDRRLPLLNHEATIDDRIKYMATLPEVVKQLILFWFASCRAQIIENYPDIFTTPDDNPKGPNFGWGGVLLSLAGGLVNLDQVSRQPYQNGLLYLRYLEAQRKEMEEKMRKKM